MKKVIICIAAIAIVALASINLSIALNSESEIDVKFGNALSFAQTENGGSSSNVCETHSSFNDGNGSCFRIYTYSCNGGTSGICVTGQSWYNICGGGRISDSKTINYCN